MINHNRKRNAGFFVKIHTKHTKLFLFRFEMPYNIWCDGCKNHIGMGTFGNNLGVFCLKCFALPDVDIVLAQESATMQRKRKWATTSALQSTGKNKHAGSFAQCTIYKMADKKTRILYNLLDALE